MLFVIIIILEDYSETNEVGSGTDHLGIGIRFGI